MTSLHSSETHFHCDPDLKTMIKRQYFSKILNKGKNTFTLSLTQLKGVMRVKILKTSSHYTLQLTVVCQSGPRGLCVDTVGNQKEKERGSVTTRHQQIGENRAQGHLFRR